MRLPGENDDMGARLSMKYMVIGVSLSLLLILGVVMLTNNANKPRKGNSTQQVNSVVAVEHEADGEEGDNISGETSVELAEQYNLTSHGSSRMKDIERLYRENKLTASDLDFWDMYPKNDPELISAEKADEEKDSKEESSKKEGNKYSDYEEEQEQDPANDGKHTLLTYTDGSEEWVLINPYLEKNTYDFTKLTMKSDKMAYYQDGKKNSYLGADISKYNGEVDFVSLKESGIDFVMLRLGARGYGSGQIMLDEKFADNITKATEAGLDIGIYFFSQAITTDEAVEEANFIMQNLSNYKITYPVAFDMEYVQNDTARIETLSREQKTSITKEFLDTVKNGGYKPMIYGTKEWLIKQIDLTKLTGYDIWLSQQEDVPDYPYQFQIWQYTLDGQVGGVNGEVDLNISFIDYSEK
ncbi:glycoside hydrolase family 25 protein [Kineothrix sp. MB12-C1]|uniref:glycoside hydrolase family 25 protein n=1 Tax=Kineothrix sp. MB12-C1 TaxID=3070215 RepID=UPI0027D1F5B5|nr:glycoside hydrolase family 25 protein [Kineothrix sp. MB12-C1]WMC92424.1 glycoside hydrolase family 25 protein [Kineothrix sp. MB12-C1]